MFFKSDKLVGKSLGRPVGLPVGRQGVIGHSVEIWRKGGRIVEHGGGAPHGIYSGHSNGDSPPAHSIVPEALGERVIVNLELCDLKQE